MVRRNALNTRDERRLLEFAKNGKANIKAGKMRRKVASFTRRFGTGAVEGYLQKTNWWLEPCRNSASYSTRWAASYCPRARLALPEPASFKPDCMSARPPLTPAYGAFAALAVAWASPAPKSVCYECALIATTSYAACVTLFVSGGALYGWLRRSPLNSVTFNLLDISTE